MAPNFEKRVQAGADGVRLSLSITVGGDTPGESFVYSRSYTQNEAKQAKTWDPMWADLRARLTGYLAEAVLRPGRGARLESAPDHARPGAVYSLVVSFGGRQFSEVWGMPEGVLDFNRGIAPNKDALLRNMAMSLATKVMHEYCPLDLFEAV